MTLRLAPSLRGLLALSLSLVAFACGATMANDPPIIDSVEAPLVVAEQNDIYAIPVTLVFHDNDGEAVTHLHYRLLPNIDGIVDVPAPNPTRQSAEVTVVIRAAELDGDIAPTRSRTGRDDRGEGEDEREKGKPRSRTRTLQLSIVDDRGAESLPVSSNVTLY